ncbi:TIGR03757 family integrating conjugative element protein [Methylomonas albis]|uniref:TIGR03757 family integrating conjugative element protein n=1 Tax=Methylomonas albis TaxID=1854563 RepID=A0ABR9D2J4_9GAMM|nr:TIGR03757 family integrating conjugative element protein [Methylomonas albis]MBD9357331.1 TIGR03757 family integrating conjugative element protein [Methylomonas albis]
MCHLTDVILQKISWLYIGLFMIWIEPVMAQVNQTNQDKPVIEVIVSDADRVTGLANLRQQGYDVKLYNLDAPKQLFASLSQNLPAKPEAAKRMLEQRMQQHGRQALQQQLVTAYQGLSVAIQYQIDRYPAVVFDRGKAVIYGVTDLQQALGWYRQCQISLTR